MLVFEKELVYGGLIGTEVARQWEQSEQECCAVRLASEAVSLTTVGNGVRKVMVFSENGLGPEMGWEQAASTYSALLCLDAMALPSTIL